MNQNKTAGLLRSVVNELPRRDRLYSEMWLEMHDEGTPMGQKAINHAQEIINRALNARYESVCKTFGL